MGARALDQFRKVDLSPLKTLHFYQKWVLVPVYWSICVSSIVVSSAIVLYLYLYMFPVKEIHVPTPVNVSQLQINQEMYEKYSQYSVDLYDVESQRGGTGFHVQAPSGNVYILTNRHVCKENASYLIAAVNGDREGIPRRILNRDWNNDLCLLEAMPRVKQGLKLATGIARHEPVYALGYPQGYELTATGGNLIGRQPTAQPVDMDRCLAAKKNQGGNLERFRMMTKGKEKICLYQIETLQTTVQINYGNSGSPLLNQKGEVVGVIWGMQLETHWGLAVPGDHVWRFLEHY